MVSCGTVVADTYVFLGKHRDAWVFGGVDPTSATAVMVELSRVASELVREGQCNGRHDVRLHAGIEARRWLMLWNISCSKFSSLH